MGSLSRGGVYNTTFNGSIWAGGIINDMSNCPLEDLTCTDFGGPSTVGGIAGMVRSGWIGQSKASGRIRGLSSVGGIAGSVDHASELDGNISEMLINSAATDHGGIVGTARDGAVDLQNDAFVSPHSYHRIFPLISNTNTWVVGQNRNQYSEMNDIGQYFKYYPERQRTERIRNVPVSSYKDGLLWWAESDALAP